LASLIKLAYTSFRIRRLMIQMH